MPAARSATTSSTAFRTSASRRGRACSRRCGLEVVTDGEFRRGSYWGRFVERTEGLEVRAALLKFRDDHGHEVDFTAPYAVGADPPHAAARAR